MLADLINIESTAFARMRERLRRCEVELIRAKTKEQELMIYQEELRHQHEALGAAQIELEESRDKYTELFEMAPIAYVLFSATGCVDQLNCAGAAMLGYPEDYPRLWIRKTPFSLFVTNADVPAFFRHIKKCKQAAGSVVSRVTLKRKDGTLFPAELTTAVIERSNGSGQIMPTAISDLTDIIQGGRSGRQHADELECRIQERTAELSRANDELRFQIEERQRIEAALLRLGEREREQFGTDLHEDLCQQLAGIALTVSAISQKLKAKGVAESEGLSALVDALGQALKQARDIAHGLHPFQLKHGGLGSALQELADQIGKDGQPVTCRFAGSELLADPPQEIALSLFRIAEEAVRNSVQHSQAKQIAITLKMNAESLQLIVEDDGLGFADESSQSSGSGIGIMRRRAERINAKILVEQLPNSGTRVTCILQP